MAVELKPEKVLERIMSKAQNRGRRLVVRLRDGGRIDIWEHGRQRTTKVSGGIEQVYWMLARMAKEK